MDQFDDLPDVPENGNKPKFLTEVGSNGIADNNEAAKGPYDNGLQPIVWDENASEPKDIDAADGKQDLQQPADMAEQPDDKDQD